MSLTLGLTGMDPATETELKAAFEQANARLGGRWQLLSETEAEHVIVDLDSMYGPMSWLRLHAAGKCVIGMTQATRTQTDFRLARPFDVDSVAALLQAVAGGADTGPQGATPTPPATAAGVADDRARPAGMAAAPVPEDELPEEHPQPVDEEAAAPGPAPGHPASAEAGTLTQATIAPAAPRAHAFADWLAPGALSGRVRYRHGAGPVLWIDADGHQYHGPTALKPLTDYFDGLVAEADFEAVAPAVWARETAALGPAQPLARLQWFGGLLAGKGALLPGFDPAGRYKLSKWPQTEREFPKHFRIATAMMKGPATLEEIVAASGVALPEVADFVNANLATGYAESAAEPAPEPTEPQGRGGLFGRLRGK